MNQFEVAILDRIQEIFACSFLDYIMPKITFLGDAGWIWIVITIIFLLIPKYRKVGVSMFLALVIESIFCNVLIKPNVLRIRPYDVNVTHQLLIAKQLDYSFPSGHTGASFAVIGTLFITKSKGKIFALILGLLIAFSRLYLYVHYPSDVLAGAILGLVSGWIACKMMDIVISKWNER